MQLEPHVEALQAELARLAELGDEKVAVAAQRLSEALGSTLPMRLLGLLSEAALEVSSQLPAGHVELRLAGAEPSLVYVADEAAPQPSGEDGADRADHAAAARLAEDLARGGRRPGGRLR